MDNLTSLLEEREENQQTESMSPLTTVLSFMCAIGICFGCCSLIKKCDCK